MISTLPHGVLDNLERRTPLTEHAILIVGDDLSGYVVRIVPHPADPPAKGLPTWKSAAAALAHGLWVLDSHLGKDTRPL